MGSCLCKKKRVPLALGTSNNAASPRSHSRGRNTSVLVDPGSRLINHFDENAHTSNVKELILQTLQLIRSLVSSEQATPSSLVRLNIIAETEDGWLKVVTCMVDVVPDDDPLGPAVLTLFLDDSPLPTKETVQKLTRSFCLDERRSMPSSWHRNVCIVLGCLAEKLAGLSSVQICTDVTLNYLIDNLRVNNDPQVIIHAMIALEKFAEISENRTVIRRKLSQYPKHPLLALENYWNAPVNEYIKEQVVFCAQWSLDNIFIVESRELSYQHSNVKNINAMLNHDDVSEYLKIGPDGLEARCDASSFESVRCTFEATEGIWYYEALILTFGVMQIGFATRNSRFCNHEGFGIGDDSYSLAYDGCRQLLWYNAKCEKHEHPQWKPGDVLGCLIDISNKYVLFYLNGVRLQKRHVDFLSGIPPDTGIFAGASFMSFQQCRFNFGHKPFRFPPHGIDFRTFNDYGSLTQEQKTILPRLRKIELLSQLPNVENCCTLCCAQPANTVLLPCHHGGFCSICAKKIRVCPLCRHEILDLAFVS
uniref:RING finger and SPRY domain-containing protein 1 n=1 Tax=Syphacia muris TaxID=451379 RepID=A0A158R567_9BILA